MHGLSKHFDPSVQIVRRKSISSTSPSLSEIRAQAGGYPAKRKPGRKSRAEHLKLRRERIKLHQTTFAEDVVQWEPHPDLADNPGAIFAAQVAQWIESYVRIRPKRGAVTPMRLNAIQEILMQFVAWRWAHGLPAKAITPKARQLGSSTFWEALLYALAELIPGYQTAIVAHHEDGIEQLFGKIQTIKNNLHKTSWGPSKLTSDQNGLYRWDTESALFTGVIRTGDALGRGGSPSAIHFSEVASFSDKGFLPEPAITALLNAMAESPWGVEIYESTAKGKDKTFFARCESARNPQAQSDLTLIFLPWYLDPGYRMQWEDYRRRLVFSGKDDPGSAYAISEEEQQLRDRINTLRPSKTERGWQHQHLIDEEQFIWRRWAIANKCNNSADAFRREYPSFYEECFTASMDAAFSEDTIQHYRNASALPLVRGDIRLSGMGKATKVQIVPNPTGCVRIWDHPMAHIPYVLGADIGGSLARSDPHCAYVMNKLTLKIVAQIHGHMEWDEYAQALLALGTYYNFAYAVVENNYNPAVANYLHQRSYKNLHYYYVQDKIEALMGQVPGYSTNKKTRAVWVSRIRTFCRTLQLVNPDPDFPPEMETFVWVPNTTTQAPEMEGTYRAIGGNHDDRIVAAALCLTQVDRLSEEEENLRLAQQAEDPPPVDPGVPPPSMVVEMFRDRVLNKGKKPLKIFS